MAISKRVATESQKGNHNKGKVQERVHSHGRFRGLEANEVKKRKIYKQDL